jgi:chemotaxis protein MotB
MLVYPKMPVPKGRQNDAGEMMSTKPFLRDSKQKWIIAIAAGVLVGGGAGFLLRPTHADEVDKAKADLATAQKGASAEKERADGLDKMLAVVQKDKADSQKQLEDLQSKASDAEKKVADAEAVTKKLQAAIGDKENGSVGIEGNEIHLKLVDKVLFAVGDDQLTKPGKAVLDKVAATLKEFPDKQIYVQGHTDDQPIYIPPPKKDPKAKPAKGVAKKDSKDKDDNNAITPPRIPTNWELAAYRALNVVHYLQDVDKIDPSRLAAVAFGQYRPVSRSNRALNRRIEIVLYPKKAILQK